MADYESCPMKRGPRNDPDSYLTVVEDVIQDLRSVRSIVESGHLINALEETARIVLCKPDRFFSYEGTVDGKRLRVPYIAYRDPVVNEDNLRNVAVSAEWSFQLAIYQVQLVTLNLNRLSSDTNFYLNQVGEPLRRGGEVYDLIQSRSLRFYNPRPHVDPSVFRDGLVKVEEHKWIAAVLFYIDYHLREGLIKKRACIKRRILSNYIRYFLTPFGLCILVAVVFYYCQNAYIRNQDL